MKYIDFNENEIQDFCKEAAKNVKDLRIKKGVKQIDLAVAININSTGSYSDYENNKQNKSLV
ncbi:helix-turn-helix domain-containing protein [Bathymodiolus septemdierum thioautotrophic gill symbiont]|uniref:XRE family transcriptional regulator n=1 Tax=endosymbiont of Bathymodiolus septemdierum str. Myojin knoll TaxID=1303921 RepID=A0A0P0URV0_9GAMM|nr:helix-turn-helix transcriptional regulator [Bathymodiolus septemdierum thioautotrophic gill symbiont]BAS67556.1 XRE family transcriptional regulator [endosymbiont of Bathymodiolus septemdierum str. Myojin knoll]